jgi:hypothetical protein
MPQRWLDLFTSGTFVMSTISSPVSARLSLTLLNAQADQYGARASVQNSSLQIGGEADGAPGSGRYNIDDINRIADTERGYLRQRLQNGLEKGRYYETHRTRSSEAEVRFQKMRAQNMSKALMRLNAGPLREGQRILSLFSPPGSHALSINTTGQVESLFLRGGDQALSINAQTVTRVHTEGGNDAITINADWVESVYTDRSGGYVPGFREDGTSYPLWQPGTDSNDAVAINARRADSIHTGGGNDAIAIQADLINSVYAGDGSDAISLSGGIISGVYGEAGDDTITVDAGIGRPAIHDLGFFAGPAGASDTDPLYTRPDTVHDRMRAAKTYNSDIQAGAGDDVISVNVQEIISIDGGSGNDVISIGSGTVGLRVGEGSGNDLVQVGHGAELMIQIDFGDYTAEIDGNDMVIRHEGGTVRIADYQNAAAIGIVAPGIPRTLPDEDESEQIAALRERLQKTAAADSNGKVTNLDLDEARRASMIAAAERAALAEQEAAKLPSYYNDGKGGLDMLYMSPPNPLDVIA